MSLAEYFKDIEGYGILSTADAGGKVNSAVYSRPHVVDEHTLAFVMSYRRSLTNVQDNPRASYLFIEKKPGYSGKRFALTKTAEETDANVIDDFRRRHGLEIYERYKELASVVAYFHIDESRPLVGDN